MWYTSDLHIGHKKIIELCRPQYSCLEEMHLDIIMKWNNKVRNKDTVYVLGDVLFDSAYASVLEKLKGTKVLILGNHDSGKMKYLFRYFNKFEGALQQKIKRGNKTHKWILTHIPIHFSELAFRFNANIHGHLHENRITTKEGYNPYVNVCLEQNNMEPFHREEIIKIIEG